MPCRVPPHTLLRVDIWANGNNLEGGGRISGATPIVCAGKYIFTLSEEPAIFTQQPLPAGQFYLSNVCLSTFDIFGPLRFKSF